MERSSTSAGTAKDNSSTRRPMNRSASYHGRRLIASPSASRIRRSWSSRNTVVSGRFAVSVRCRRLRRWTRWRSSAPPFPAPSGRDVLGGEVDGVLARRSLTTRATGTPRPRSDSDSRMCRPPAFPARPAPPMPRPSPRHRRDGRTTETAQPSAVRRVHPSVRSHAGLSRVRYPSREAVPRRSDDISKSSCTASGDACSGPLRVTVVTHSPRFLTRGDRPRPVRDNLLDSRASPVESTLTSRKAIRHLLVAGTGYVE